MKYEDNSCIDSDFLTVSLALSQAGKSNGRLRQRHAEGGINGNTIVPRMLEHFSHVGGQKVYAVYFLQIQSPQHEPKMV